MIRKFIVIVIALTFVLGFSNASMARGPGHNDNHSDYDYNHDPGGGSGSHQFSFEITSIEVIVDLAALPFLIVTSDDGDQIIVFVIGDMLHLDGQEDTISEGDELTLTGVGIMSSFFIAFALENNTVGETI